jgi:hypothetical protein
VNGALLNELAVFKELMQNLNADGVKYLLVGGMAVVAHGYGRNLRILADEDGTPEDQQQQQQQS